MQIDIYPGRLHGSVRVQASKSQLHRALICAALAEGVSRIRNICESQDVLATLKGIISLGLAQAQIQEDAVEIRGGSGPAGARPAVDCGESGTTLRFLTPIALTRGEGALFTGRGRLLERPMGPYEDLFKAAGVKISRNREGMQVQGRLAPQRYALAGNVSSQFISGLLLALPLLEGTSHIDLLTPLESKDYVEMTLETMALFGVRAFWEDDRTLAVPGGQCYRAADLNAEGDWSHAAFFLAAGALGGDVTCRGLNLKSSHGDRIIFSLLRRMGAEVHVDADAVRVAGGSLRGWDVDASQIPDLVPVLSVLACGCRGETLIYNAGRLRMKESDRLSAMSLELNALGASVEEGADWLKIKGGTLLTGGRCHSHNDHRVAMSLAVASAISRETIVLSGAHSVNKSAPGFWDDFKGLGGNIHGGCLG
jgi:3-phosphoshikimate 1-carboxyvinyltransferase